MTRQLHMAGRNSNEIYTLLYPNNLITFCKYDFTPFLNHCTDLCRLANRTGEYSVEDVYAIRNSISGCHKYYEQNMRTVFEKIVIDCWIDYLCRQSEASAAALWQSFMRCKNDFERAVFGRLSEYRYNRAINEWVTLIKLQEYAQKKTDFIFGITLAGVTEAGARANYFDLMFNVAANEQGFPVSEIGASAVYSSGRVPNSPFILSSASREILRNVLNDMEDTGAYHKKKINPELSDQAAMDAFSVVKNYIPDKNDSLVKTIIKSMSGSPQRVYLPCSFKSVIDLEIDALIESGGILQRCPRCGEYFVKDEEYPYDYCNRPQKDGTTCLEAAERGDSVPAVPVREELPEEEEPPKLFAPSKPLEKSYVNEKMEALYKEMAARVNVDLTQRDFSRWYQRELQLKELILLGQAGEAELQDFIELSRGDEFASRKQPPLFEKKADPEEEPIAVTETGKEVKRFVFERVERTAEPVRAAEPARASLAASEQAANEAVQRLFAARQTGYPPSSPSYAYQKPSYPQQPKPITRIIRGGAANSGYTERPFDAYPKPKTVVIPNGEDRARVSVPTAPAPARREVPDEDADMKLYRDEDDVKVFTPRRARAAAPENTPYTEKIKQPLEEYRREREERPAPSAETEPVHEEVPERNIAESPAPAPRPAASAKALSAYRTHSAAPSENEEEKRLEKADFAGILESMNRSDGFKNEETELDSDGLPVSHKTQHVMNALFGPTRVSPFLKVNLDDDEEN